MPAYVPHYAYDVFVSYAHVSKGWVTQFKNDLQQKLTERMSPAPCVWMDDSNLRKAGAYPEDLAASLRGSAILLTINCEPYLDSDWCAWELVVFREKFGHDPRTNDGGRRIVEVIKASLPDGSAPIIQPDNSGFWFCGGSNDDPSKDTFEPGSIDYDFSLRRLAREIGKLLFSLRKESQSVFLAPPVDATDLTSPMGKLYRKLRTELRQEYQVVPLPGTSFSDDDYLARSQISVYFISEKFDEQTTRRIKMARVAGGPVLVVIAPGLDPKSPNSNFLSYLKTSVAISARDAPSDLQFLNWIPGKHDSGTVVSMIRRMISQQEPPPPASQFSVYLVCDPRDIQEEEVKGLLSLGELFKIFDQFKEFDVITNLDKVKRLGLTAQELRTLFDFCEEVKSLLLTFELPRSTQDQEDGFRDHMRKLAMCDGLLLLWGCAEEEWFKKYSEELPAALGFRAGRPLYSKAVIIRPEEERKMKFARNIVDAEDIWEGIDIDKLASFLRSLLAAKKAYAIG
jgi:hypothetical protein